MLNIYSTSVAVGIVFISLLCFIYIAVYKGSRRHGNLCFFFCLGMFPVDAWDLAVI